MASFLPTTRQKYPLFKIIADGESCIKTINDKEQQEIKRMTLSTKWDKYSIHVN